jgi:hypothetical protein
MKPSPQVYRKKKKVSKIEQKSKYSLVAEAFTAKLNGTTKLKNQQKRVTLTTKVE